MIAALIRWSVANRFLVLLASAFVAAAGVWSVRTTPLDAIPDLSDTQVIIRTTFAGPGAADRRGPGHVSADDDDAVGPGREGGARLFVLRRFVRLRDLRGRHRPVLGALARARIPEPGAGPPSAGGEGVARSRCDRRGLDLRIRARRSRRRTRPRAAAGAAGLVPQVRAEGAAERRRSRDRRRHGAAVPGRRRSGAAQGVQPAARQGDRGDSRRQSGSRRLGGRARRGGVHGAHARLSQVARRFPRDTGAGLRGRHAGVPEGRRARPAWTRDAPRHRRARRRGRGRRRHRRAALGQERVGDDPGGQGAARAAEARVAGRGRDRSRLRPFGADRACGGPSQGQARRGVRRRRARVPRCSCCICAPRWWRSCRCRSACWRRSS